MKLTHYRGNRRLGSVAALCACAVCAYAQDDWTDSRASFICRSDNEIREIKTYIASPRADGSADRVSCRVDYIKDGKTTTIWSSHTSATFCDGKAASLAAKLEGDRFACTPLHAVKPPSG